MVAAVLAVYAVELNTRTKIAGGVLALALAALGVDQFLPGPATAEAGSPVAEAAPAVATPRTSKPAAKPGALARRLAQLGGTQEGVEREERDVFVAPVSWFTVVSAEPLKKVEAKVAPAPTSAHRLTSVGSGGVAQIDGHVLKVGKPVVAEGLDGKRQKYELLSLEQDDSKRVWVAQVRIGKDEVRLDLTLGADDAAGCKPGCTREHIHSWETAR